MSDAVSFDALEVAAEAEVVVVGGGPGGLCAAVAAAEEGADTLLIERYGFLGGMATAGLVNPFMTWHAGGKPIIRGLFERIIERLDDYGGWAGPRQGSAFDDELLKLVADDLCEEADVRLRLHTMLAHVDTRDGRVSRIATLSKSGLQQVKGEVFIDATGDGDLAARAGAEVEIGREEDGLCQPMTLCFRMVNVDLDRVPSRGDITELYDAARERGEIDNPRENVLFFFTTHENEVHLNTTRIVKHDPTNAEDMTHAELQARRQVREMVRFLTREVSGFEEAWLQEIAPQIGVRESRRVMGDYVLTTEDVLAARTFDDGIARGSYCVDIHNPAGSGTVIKRLPPGEAYDIPYRCLTPRGFENLLIAARCVSCDHGAHSSLRVMPIVMAIGEAAGCAAQMALATGDVRAVDADQLRLRLHQRGASIHGLSDER
ncbi:MAG: FAD-dependent oxidoreductase [Armatimonadota bacterium]|nr:FAD-dependent oxidoreductase [Armatimonadota bacterium]